MEKAIFCWSGGKDSSYCLHKVLTEKKFDIRYLLSTVDVVQNRVQVHGVRIERIVEQATATGIELLLVHVPESSNESYEARLKEIFLKAKSVGITQVIYGDIFLKDLREYREKFLSTLGMTAVFPLWELNTAFLVQDFLQKGFRALACCVDSEVLSEHWVGREIDESFVRELPAGADPCGENGEFHTFCFEGPIFASPIPVYAGAKRFQSKCLKMVDQQEREKGYWFCEVEKGEARAEN